MINELINLCQFSRNHVWSLIYQASQHGFSARNFHEYCNNKPNTLVIIKTTQGYVFGGYTKVTWNSEYHNSNNYYKSDPNSFIFSLKNKEKNPIKLITVNGQIFCNPSYGPTFGNGHDIYICKYSNTNSSSYSKCDNSYKHPNYINGSSSPTQSFLADSYNFQVSEIEVYSHS